MSSEMTREQKLAARLEEIRLWLERRGEQAMADTIEEAELLLLERPHP